jgi:hypothetical protein
MELKKQSEFPHYRQTMQLFEKKASFLRPFSLQGEFRVHPIIIERKASILTFSESETKRFRRPNNRAGIN